jgi:hypothetical protein
MVNAGEINEDVQQTALPQGPDQFQTKHPVEKQIGRQSLAPGGCAATTRGSMYRMNDDQARDGDVQEPNWLEIMASRSVCPETVQGWIYYCDEHETHGNADSENEGRHMAAAHVDYFLEHDGETADPCEVFVFARPPEANGSS